MKQSGAVWAVRPCKAELGGGQEITECGGTQEHLYFNEKTEFIHLSLINTFGMCLNQIC